MVDAVEESWAVVQNAPGISRRGKSGTLIMALVNRLKCVDLWWTAENPEIVMQFHKKHAADHSAARLKGTRVIPYEAAYQQIVKQQKMFGGAK